MHEKSDTSSLPTLHSKDAFPLHHNRQLVGSQKRQFTELVLGLPARYNY